MTEEQREFDDYVISKLNLGMQTGDIYRLVQIHFNYQKARKTFQNRIGTIRRLYKHRIKSPHNAKDEMIARLKASNQKLQDKNRIANGLLRKDDRYFNAVESLLTEISFKLNKLKSFKIGKIKPYLEVRDKTAIIQVTDLHFGEEITWADTLGYNQFNMLCGSKRMWKYAKKIKYFLGDSVSDIVVAFTGDLMNSDRRSDELLTNFPNRSETYIQTLEILGSFLIDLAKDYKIKVVSVLGNESRMDQDMPFSNPTHNFDFLIHKELSMLLSQHRDRIKFINCERNYETLYPVSDLNVLFFHGYKYNPKLVDKITSKYNKIGKLLDYIITGHLHSTNSDDKQSRSGSVVGSNYYSTFGLHLLSNATQTLYVIEKEGKAKKSSIYPIIIDLQNVEGCDAYQFDEDVCNTEDNLPLW